MNVKELALAQQEYIVSCRRWLHAHPEESCKEVETTKFIIAQLEEMGVPYITYEGCTGCVAVIEGAQPGKTVMLRADIDALPIQEVEGREYGSVNPGVMHACGHDAHTAMLLGAVRILKDYKDAIKGTVKCIFQMGEEIGRKSEEYVKQGALEGVDAIMGMHVWSAMDSGTANFESGERMACSDRFTIKIKGKSSHGSAPHEGHDAILAAAHAVMDLQTIPSRQLDPVDALVVTVGKMNGGTKQNILCGEVELVGTVRAFNKAFRNSMPQRIEAVVTNAVKAFGCTAECDYYFGPSPLINEWEDLNELGRSAAEKIIGPGCLRPLTKMLGAEDFSVYTEHIPGVYGYIGLNNPAKGLTGIVHHHPAFDVDEDVLYQGTGIYVQFAVDYLEQKA